MTDLATERARVMANRDEAKAEALLRARVRHCRQLLTEPRSSHQPQAAKSIEEAAHRLFPELPEHELAEIIERANQPEDRGRTVSTIETSVVKDITRKYLEANRDASARDAWQHVIQHGQPTFQESSFPAFVSGIRKELGISMGSGPKPKSEGATPSRPRARIRQQTERPIASRKERAARLKAKRANVEASMGTPAPKKNGRREVPVATTAADASATVVQQVAMVERSPERVLFHDGDRITLELGGEKLDARRAGGRWTCDVGDAVLEAVMGRMLAGAVR